MNFSFLSCCKYSTGKDILSIDSILLQKITLFSTFEKKADDDYGAQIGVPGSVSNWDSSSTLGLTEKPGGEERSAKLCSQVYGAAYI